MLCEMKLGQNQADLEKNEDTVTRRREKLLTHEAIKLFTNPSWNYQIRKAIEAVLG